MKFSDLSVIKKISAVFFVIACCILVQVSFVSMQLEKVEKALYVITAETIPSMTLANNIKNDVIRIRKDQFSLISSIDSSKLKNWIADIDAVYDSIDGYLSQYKKFLNYADDRDLARYTEVEKRWIDYKNANRDFVPLLLQGEAAKANADILASFDSFDQLVAAVDKLEELNADFVREDSAISLEKLNTTEIYSFVGVGVVLAFMVFVGGFLSKQICTPLSAVIVLAQKIAAGDLTHTLDRSAIGNDELGDLATACTQMQDKLHQLVEQISSASEQLGVSIEEVSVVSDQTSQGMNEQQEQLTLISTAMHEMQATVADVAKNTEDASTSAHSATADAGDATAVVDQSINTIQKAQSVIQDAGDMVEQLEKDTSEINMVADVIRGIAEQTNLLALNAAIEAARAGEQGRGFAVVADEVRTLAGRTQSSTEEIAAIIEQLQSRAKQAVQATGNSCELIDDCVKQTQQTGNTIVQISDSINEIAMMSTQIASACSEQTSVSEELNRNIENINMSSSGVADGSLQTSKSCLEISQLVVNLQGMIRQFKIS